MESREWALLQAQVPSQHPIVVASSQFGHTVAAVVPLDTRAHVDRETGLHSRVAPSGFSIASSYRSPLSLPPHLSHGGPRLSPHHREEAKAEAQR